MSQKEVEEFYMFNMANVVAAAVSFVAYFVISLPVMAADTEVYSTYLALQTSDQNRNYSSFTRANWGDGNEVAKAGGKYYVPVGMELWSPAGTSTFAGDVLAVAGTFSVANDGYCSNIFKDLIMLPGGVCKHKSNTSITAESIKILGTAEQPVLFDWFIQSGRTITYNAAFVGAENSRMEFGRGNKDSVERSDALTTKSQIGGDFSQYFGRLVLGVGTYGYLVCDNKDGETTRIAHAYPGTIELKKDSILSTLLKTTARTNIVGGLVLNPGSELNLYTHGVYGHFTVFTVTNQFEASGNFRIGFSYDRSPAYEFDYTTLGRNGHIPLMHLTGNATETCADFSESTITNMYIKNRIGNLPENVRLGLVENGDGSKDVSVVWDPVVLMNKDNGSNGANSPLAFSEGDCWSTGSVPGEDFSGSALVDASAIAVNAWQDISRSKMKLTVKPGSTMYHQGKSLTLGELHMVGGSSVLTYSGATTPAFFGKLVVWPGSKAVIFSGWNKKCYMMYSEILGSGEISVKNHNPTSVSMELFGTNVNYSGSFTVDSHVDSWIPESGTDECTTLYLNDGRNLGGPYSGDDGWKALAVKGHSSVEVRDDVTLDEPTRGIYIENAARFKVPEGKTFAINQNITFAGELEKLGAGRLSLGGGACFVDSDSLTETKRLAVSEGVLKVVSTNALDGVETKFAVATMLELDAFPSGDGMAEWGIVNTKYDTPFAAAGKVKVSFIDDGTEVLDSVSVAICTVKSEAAASLPFVSGRLRSGFYSKTSLRDNGNGTKTLLVEHQRMGTRIVVR